MKLTTLLATFSFLNFTPAILFAQEIERIGSGKILPTIYAFVKEGTVAGRGVDNSCALVDTETLPSDALVVATTFKACAKGNSRNARGNDFLEVVYAGDVFTIDSNDARLTVDERRQIVARSSEDIEATRSVWRDASLLAKSKQIDVAIKEIDASARRGIAILEAMPYDVSEYTEGTGFKVRILNWSKKTIKYVNFKVSGYNSVGDAVAPGYGGNRAVTIRGVGPIEPDGEGLYSKDYLWMTDLVQSARIESIVLEYMDGSKRTLSSNELKHAKLSKSTLSIMSDTNRK